MNLSSSKVNLTPRFFIDCFFLGGGGVGVGNQISYPDEDRLRLKKHWKQTKKTSTLYSHGPNNLV